VRNAIGAGLGVIGYLSGMVFIVWAAILDLGVLLNVGGVVPFVVGFFLLPIAFVAVPLYAGFALGDWHPLRVTATGLMMPIFGIVGTAMMSRDGGKEEKGATPRRLLRWFFARTAALPVKILLLGWLGYAIIVAGGGALIKLAAAAKVTMAVLGVLATAVVFPVLLAHDRGCGCGLRVSAGRRASPMADTTNEGCERRTHGGSLDRFRRGGTCAQRRSGEGSWVDRRPRPMRGPSCWGNRQRAAV
jgi:hypothetical protein